MSVTTCPASAFSGLKFAGVNKNTQHAGAAWKLTEHGMLSSRISVNADRKIADADYARIISAEIEKGASLPLIPQWPAILETFRQSLQAAAAGPKTREQALADAHKEIEAIFVLPLGRKATCTRASDRALWPEALLLRSGIAFPIEPFAALRAMLPHCRRQRRRSRMLGEKWTGYWVVLRGAITLAVTLGFPAVTASLESVGLVGRRGGVSLANCTRVLGDVQFPVTTWSTLVYVVAVVSFYLVMGLAVALLLDLDVPGRWVFRVLAILPWTMPDVIGGLVFRSLFDTLTGGVNAVGIMLGPMQEPKDWLGSPSSALFSVIMEESWRG